jgi:hypothetical protein
MASIAFKEHEIWVPCSQEHINAPYRGTCMHWHDMIYLLTAGVLTPGGSSTAHVYTEQHNETEYPERNTHNKNT